MSHSCDSTAAVSHSCDPGRRAPRRRRGPSACARRRPVPGSLMVELPAMLRPMLATPGPPPAGAGWSVEFKWDGIRAIVATAPGGRVRIWSRNGNDVTASYPELATGPAAEALGERG